MSYYSHAGQVIAMRNTTGLHWMFGDHLGSNSTVRTPAGTNIRQRYLPFGRLRGAASLPTEYGFTGQRLDPSGLMDYNARQYDPILGRFTSPDTIIPDAADPQSFNRYSYVNNNPVNFTDPTGHCASATTPSGSQAVGWSVGGCPEGLVLETAPSPTAASSPEDLVDGFNLLVDVLDRAATEVLAGRHSAEMNSLRDSLGAFARHAKPIGRAAGFAGNLVEGVGAGAAIGSDTLGAFAETGDLSYSARVALWATGREVAGFMGGEAVGFLSANLLGAGCTGVSGGNLAAGAGCAAFGYGAGNLLGGMAAEALYEDRVDRPRYRRDEPGGGGSDWGAGSQAGGRRAI